MTRGAGSPARSSKKWQEKSEHSWPAAVDSCYSSTSDTWIGGTLLGEPARRGRASCGGLATHCSSVSSESPLAVPQLRTLDINGT